VRTIKDDAQLRRDVEDELEWDPHLDARDIAVAVKIGVVTLAGHVGSYAERFAAERATGRVSGVKGIANDIAVRSRREPSVDDTRLAQAAVTALRINMLVPRSVRAVVRDGWITLQGVVDTACRKNAAEAAVRHLRSVRGVTNDIVVRTSASLPDVRAKIEAAFQRHANLEAQRITVSVADGAVTLSGEVPTWQERLAAETAALNAPRVARVENRVVVR
jgi:osmotically-inducible protein OsmY